MKIFQIITVFFLVTMLMGCGTTKSGNTTNTDSSTKNTTAEKQLTEKERIKRAEERMINDPKYIRVIDRSSNLKKKEVKK